ncbi:hypothetical protein EBU99_07685 [bacterium]|nr:hypothetical protein [bacterium]
MKLAEVCTVYPSTWDASAVRNPGAAIPLAIRLKLRAQRGYLQAALDTHPQRSANRMGLGLRPYEAGDSLRAVSARHLLLQEELQTRTDVSPGRFHVTVIVHCYANMQFKSEATDVNKMQAAWAVAGLLQNLHEQQAQRVDVIALSGPQLGEELVKHAALLRRSHFCYVVTDLLFNPNSIDAASEELSAALSHLHVRNGIVAVVRDPWESPDFEKTAETTTIAFASPSEGEITKNASLMGEKSAGEERNLQNNRDRHSGQEYIQNLRSQLNGLQTLLNLRGWGSLWLTAEHAIDDISQKVAVNLAAQRI